MNPKSQKIIPAKILGIKSLPTTDTDAICNFSALSFTAIRKIDHSACFRLLAFGRSRFQILLFF